MTDKEAKKLRLETNAKLDKYGQLNHRIEYAENLIGFIDHFKQKGRPGMFIQIEPIGNGDAQEPFGYKELAPIKSVLQKRVKKYKDELKGL